MSVQQQLLALELLRRINPQSLLRILVEAETPQELEEIGYLMEKTPYDETLASAFLKRSYALGLDLMFAQAYISTMLSSAMLKTSEPDSCLDSLYAGLDGAVIPPGGA